jgi:predicted nucleic acid-binding protein
VRFLLDTNVVSELRKSTSGRADPNVVRWADSVAPESVFISVISVEEIEIGVLLTERRDRKQGVILRDWLENLVLPAFPGRILDVNLAIARKSASLHVPNVGPVRDTLMAATALVHRMTLVTRNTGDFSHAGLSLVNPWDRPATA